MQCTCAAQRARFTKGAVSVNIDDSETSEKRYTLRPTFTPLPSKRDANDANKGSESTAAAATEAEPHPTAEPSPKRPASSSNATKAKASPGAAKANSLIRAANEDDDLYDPYSDYHDGTLKAAEFEEDPWR